MDWKILGKQPPSNRTRIVAVANQKGGVAKTTTVVNLGAALALRGHEVLIVDVDPQANATTGLGLDPRGGGPSTYELVTARMGAGEVIQGTAVRRLSLAAASQDLAGAEVELVPVAGRELRLAEALGPVRGDYDVILLDCPPSLGLLTVNALAAASDLLIPVQCEYYALEGLGQLLGNAERARSSLNPDLRITGVLLTMFDGRTKLSGQVADEVRGHFGRRVFETVIPRSVRLSEAPSFGEPVVTLDPSSRGAKAYRSLSVEVETRFGLAVHPPPPPPAPQPGPGGRGYGVPTSQPETTSSWPPADPWGGVPVDQGAGS